MSRLKWTLGTPYDDKLLKAGLNTFEIKRVVPEARRATKRTWRTNLLQWAMIVIFMATFVALLIGILINWQIEHPIPAIVLVAALVAAFLLPPFLMLHLKNRRTLRAALRIAEALDSRYCPTCGYEIRASDLKIECCPECGTYISRRPRSDRPTPVSRRDDDSGWIAGGLAFPDAYQLTPQQIESMLLKVRDDRPASWFRREKVQGYILTFLILGMFFLVVRYVDAYLTLFQSLVVTAAPIVVIYICMYLLGRRRMNRDAHDNARKLAPLLHDIGFHACPDCNNLLGPNQQTCTVCNARI